MEGELLSLGWPLQSLIADFVVRNPKYLKVLILACLGQNLNSFLSDFVEGNFKLPQKLRVASTN